MKLKYITTIFIFAIMVTLSGCKTFEKIEITDHYYVRLPYGSTERFSISVPTEYDGVTYSFANNVDSVEIVMGNHYYHFLVSFCPPDYIKFQHDFDKLQNDSGSKELRFSWIGPETVPTKNGSDNGPTYWGGLLFFKPHFARHLDWYFIAFRYVPKDKLQLYKKALRLRHHTQPLRKKSPWEPLFSQDKIEHIDKIFN